MPKDPDTLVDLTTARTAFEAEMIAESLRAQGIRAEAFTTAGTMLQWDIAGTQPMRVQVRRADLDKAAAALRAIRADSVDLDWDEVDTGDPTPVTPKEQAAKDGARWICVRCRYDLTGLPLDRACPECGASVTDPRPIRNVPSESGTRRRVLWAIFLVLISVLVALRITDGLWGPGAWVFLGVLVVAPAAGLALMYAMSRR